MHSRRCGWRYSRWGMQPLPLDFGPSASVATDLLRQSADCVKPAHHRGPSLAAASQAPAARSAGATRSEPLDVEVHYRQRVLLNEVAARLDLVTHEGCEDVVRGHR